jgi:hypothetical protein
MLQRQNDELKALVKDLKNSSAGANPQANLGPLSFLYV